MTKKKFTAKDSIPIFFSLSAGRASFIPLDAVQVHEMLLTTAQAVYGAVCMFGLKFKLHHAVTLLILFLTQFFIPETRLTITYIFIALTFVELFVQRKNINVFRYFRSEVFGK